MSQKPVEITVETAPRYCVGGVRWNVPFAIRWNKRSIVLCKVQQGRSRIYLFHKGIVRNVIIWKHITYTAYRNWSCSIQIGFMFSLFDAANSIRRRSFDLDYCSGELGAVCDKPFRTGRLVSSTFTVTAHISIRFLSHHPQIINDLNPLHVDCFSSILYRHWKADIGGYTDT